MLERRVDDVADPTYDHDYLYRLVERGRIGGPRPGLPLASIDVVAPADAFRSPSAGRWWLLTRRALRYQGPERPGASPFDLTITVAPPLGWRGSLITLMKPLVDGVVSALHRHDGPLQQVLERAERIEPHLTPNELRHLLLAAPAPLGPVRLATPWRDGLQWRPSDERIDRLDVHLDHDAPPGTVRARAHLEPDQC